MCIWRYAATRCKSEVWKHIGCKLINQTLVTEKSCLALWWIGYTLKYFVVGGLIVNNLLLWTFGNLFQNDCSRVVVNRIQGYWIESASWPQFAKFTHQVPLDPDRWTRLLWTFFIVLDYDDMVTHPFSLLLLAPNGPTLQYQRYSLLQHVSLHNNLSSSKAQIQHCLNIRRAYHSILRTARTSVWHNSWAGPQITNP